ncbi:hypothetical protein EBU71_00165 [bacterium]|nr:hypothetical protein [Candidatus Elulimicrobium humile]
MVKKENLNNNPIKPIITDCGYYRRPTPEELYGIEKLIQKSKFHQNTKDMMYMCIANLHDFTMCHGFDDYGAIGFAKLLKECGISLDNYITRKRESTSNYASVIFTEIVKLFEENDNDKSKRVKGIGRRILIAKLKELLPNVKSSFISKSINSNIKLQVLTYITQSKSRKLLIKGQYWNTYVKSNKV